MLPPVLAKLLVCLDKFNQANAYSKSIFVMQNGSYCTLVISVDIWLNNSSMFGMCALNFMQPSFSFIEFYANLTGLTFFTVLLPEIQNDPLQLSIISLNVHIDGSYLFLLRHSFVDDTVWV